MTVGQDMDRLREAALMDKVRAVVRAEIVAALQALGREADAQDMPYETGELESSALSAIGKVMEGTVRRLTCEHGDFSHGWHRDRCSRCGEPGPEPENPFEPKPLDPGCNHAFASFETHDTCQLCEGVKPRG